MKPKIHLRYQNNKPWFFVDMLGTTCGSATYDSMDELIRDVHYFIARMQAMNAFTQVVK